MQSAALEIYGLVIEGHQDGLIYIGLRTMPGCSPLFRKSLQDSKDVIG